MTASVLGPQPQSSSLFISVDSFCIVKLLPRAYDDDDDDDSERSAVTDNGMNACTTDDDPQRRSPPSRTELESHHMKAAANVFLLIGPIVLARCMLWI
jgi:hypothetical protein